MRVLLFILFFVSAAAAQNFQFVPAHPQEIVRFKQQFSAPAAEPIIFFQLPDEGQRLATLGKQNVQVWDTKKGALLSSIPHDAGKEGPPLYGRLMSPDGSKLVVVDAFRWGIRKEKTPVAANVYDLRTGKFLAKISGEKISVRNAEWSANGKTLATMSNNFSDAKETEVCFWDGDTLTKKGCLFQDGRVDWERISNDGKRFYAAIDASTKWIPRVYWFLVVDTENGNILTRIGLKDVAWTGSASISPSGKFLVQDHSGSIEIGEIGKNYQRNFEVRLPKGSSYITFGSFSPDEKLAAIKNGKNGTEVYDTRTGELKRTLSGMDYNPTVWAADDKVLVGYYCGKAKAWSFETGAPLYQIKLVCKDHFELAETVTDDEDQLILHPDRKYLLTYSGTAVRIWDAASGELLQTVVAPGREAEKIKNPKTDDMIKGRTARWSDDGKYLYVLANDERSVLQYEFTGK
jgi:WD40 repeat protein